MSFINTIKKVFGLASDDAEMHDDPDLIPAPQQLVAVPSDPSEPLTADTEMVQMIFDSVVRETNRSLPDYLAKSVDPEKQKKFLYESLEQSVKDYLAALESAANEKCRLQWMQEREAQMAETESLKQRGRELEAKRNEIKEKQLSAERQKRALQERVHDLEMKVISLEAEKEQYEIENKSLVNKAKVAGVYEKEIEELQAQLRNAVSGTPAAADDKTAELTARIESLTAEHKHEKDLLHKERKSAMVDLDRTKSELAETRDKLEHTIRDLQHTRSEFEHNMAKLAEAKEKIAILEEECKTAKVKDEMGQAMLNDLQKKASEAIEGGKMSDSRISELELQIQEMHKHIKTLEIECIEKDKLIAENAEAMADFDEIVAQVDLFEEVKAKLNDKIAKLRAELTEAQNDNEALKTTIKNNLYIHAQQEKAMQDEIDNLRTVSVDKNPAQEDKPKEPEIPYPSLFDEEEDETAWKSSDERTDDLIADSGWIK